MFGVSDNGNGTATFYTRGTDRISTRLNDFLDDCLNLEIYEKGGDAWESFQQHLANALVSTVVVRAEVVYRPDYEKINAILSGEAPVSSLAECGEHHPDYPG